MVMVVVVWVSTSMHVLAFMLMHTCHLGGGFLDLLKLLLMQSRTTFHSSIY